MLFLEATLPLTAALPGQRRGCPIPSGRLLATHTTKKGGAENVQISLKLKLLPPFKKSL